MSRVRARADQWYNVKKVPLYPSNPLDYVIIDSLRLFLRISDNLINLLILELLRLDAEKDKYLDKFSINNWEKMAFMGKSEGFLLGPGHRDLYSAILIFAPLIFTLSLY